MHSHPFIVAISSLGGSSPPVRGVDTQSVGTLSSGPEADEFSLSSSTDWNNITINTEIIVTNPDDAFYVWGKDEPSPGEYIIKVESIFYNH